MGIPGRALRRSFGWRWFVGRSLLVASHLWRFRNHRDIGSKTNARVSHQHVFLFAMVNYLESFVATGTALVPTQTFRPNQLVEAMDWRLFTKLSTSYRRTTRNTSKPTIHVVERTTKDVWPANTRRLRSTILTLALPIAAAPFAFPEVSPTKERATLKTVAHLPIAIPTRLSKESCAQFYWMNFKSLKARDPAQVAATFKF